MIPYKSPTILLPMGLFYRDMKHFTSLISCAAAFFLGTSAIPIPNHDPGVTFRPTDQTTNEQFDRVANRYNSLISALRNNDFEFDQTVRAVRLQSSITRTQPFTGLVFWYNNGVNYNENLDVQLEFLYIPFNETVVGPGPTYNWTWLETRLDAIASRGHQAIMRPHAVWPGRETTLPQWLKEHTDYQETQQTVSGAMTWMEDWRPSSPLAWFYNQFFQQLTQRYNQDKRVAFLQVGFGSYGEYHLWGGDLTPGFNFPPLWFQKEFHEHLNTSLTELRWQFSIDARWFQNAGDLWTQSWTAPTMNTIQNGLFDDSLFLEGHSGYNMDLWNAFDYSERNELYPSGGEIGFRLENSTFDPNPASYPRWIQEYRALDPEGIHGETWEQKMGRLKLQFVIGSWMNQYHSFDRINEASRSMGYKFRITRLQSFNGVTEVTVENFGYSPIFYDAFITVNRVRASESLKGLRSGQSKQFILSTPNLSSPLRVTIECDRLVEGQTIQYEADTRALVQFMA